MVKIIFKPIQNPWDNSASTDLPRQRIKEKADTEFQYRPRIVDTDIDCGPFLRTPFPRLLEKVQSKAKNESKCGSFSTILTLLCPVGGSSRTVLLRTNLGSRQGSQESTQGPSIPPHPKDPSVLFLVRSPIAQCFIYYSVVNLLHVVIHYSKDSKSVPKCSFFATFSVVNHYA